MVSLGKSAVSQGTASRWPGADRRKIPALDALLEASKNVQNRGFETRVASLLSTRIHMPENNYPQTYPRLEDMLVNTNITPKTTPQNLRPE